MVRMTAMTRRMQDDGVGGVHGFCVGGSFQS